MSNVEEHKKKKVNRNPISKELSRTKQYALALSKVYGKYITPCIGSSYKRSDTKMSFFCHLCQGITTAKASTMLRGSGCRQCRTNEKHIEALNEHKFQLETSSTFRLAADPVTFNHKSKNYYKCKECDTQTYL